MSNLELRQRQTQRLIMTQELRQAIEMLQLSTLDLAELISRELLENPLIEEAETRDGMTPDDDVTLNLSGQEPPPRDEETHSFTGDDAEWTEPYRREEGDRRIDLIEKVLSPPESLMDHLMSQAGMLCAGERERGLFLAVISSLDGNGFLAVNPGELACSVDATAEEIESVIADVSLLDPVGCAVMDSRQSLLVQARHRYPGDGIMYRMIRDHFDDLERLDYDHLARGLETTREEILARTRLIGKLDPFPGRRFSREETRYIVPDVEVYLVDGEIIVTLKDEYLPRININRMYASLLAGSRLKGEQRNYISERLSAAKTFMKNLETRRDTIRRVITAIMEHQRDFLEKGPGNLRSLTHLEVADHLGIHESTVSRVASNKYAQTHWGVFPIRYFFVSRIRSADSTEPGVSSDVARGLIQELVAAEDPRAPLSDDDLVRLCGEKGVNVARRTVAKYRGMLGIPSSSTRRKLNLIRQEGIV